MKNIYYLLILSFVLLNTNCNKAYYSNLEEVIPAKHVIPTHIKTITLLDRSKEKSVGISIENTLETGQITDNEGRVFLKQIQSKIPATTHLSPKSFKHSFDGGVADILNKEDINNYAENRDALLCLEQLFYKETFTYVNKQKHQLDENGNDYYLDVVECTQENQMQIHLRLYDTKSGAILLETPYIEEASLIAEGLTKEGVTAKMDSMQVNRKPELSKIIEKKVKSEFAPKEIRSNWLYYTKGEEIIKRSAMNIRHGNFEKVISLLQPKISTLSSKKKTRQKAVHNLAVSLYLTGQTEAALEAIRKELSQNGNHASLIDLQKKIVQYSK